MTYLIYHFECQTETDLSTTFVPSSINSMKRPVDQAKLLLLYLLRSTSAALATNANNDMGHICLRLARRTDVPALQRCNLASLPENYNAEFYAHHLRTWPGLALVAEYILPGQQSISRSFPGSQAESNIVGYVLGKIEDRYVSYDPRADPSPAYGTKTYRDLEGNTLKLESTGHVTSLAVLRDFRRRGLATALIDQLHVNLESVHGVSQVGLHVRQSNEAATNLYKSYGYHVEEVLDHYYADGESAFLMRRKLNPTVKSKPSLRLGQPFVTSKEIKSLPRIIWQQTSGDESPIKPNTSVEIMTTN
jgi:N-alpha-acetyltransferase 10/11